MTINPDDADEGAGATVEGTATADAAATADDTGAIETGAMGGGVAALPARGGLTSTMGAPGSAAWGPSLAA